MTLPAPNLDDRRFEDLLRELQQLIPQYTPELLLDQDDWTDWNETDPGTTLLQLWAHLAETILYRVNRIPERAYIKFLDLIGLDLEPARPARADLTFTPQPGFNLPAHLVGIAVPKETQVQAQPPGGGDPLIFETENALDLVRASLTSVQVGSGGTLVDRSELNVPEGSTYEPLGWVPQPGNALYLGFAPPDPPIEGRIFPSAFRLRPFLPATSASDSLVEAPDPDVVLVWEYRKSAEDPGWRALETYQDETGGFTKNGYVTIEGPSQIGAIPEVGRIEEPHLWIRCRLAEGAYPAGRVPRISFIRANTVRAVNLSTVRHEVLGSSEGHPDEFFQLRRVPMQPETLLLEVEEGDEFVAWERRDDLLASEPASRHFTVDGASGTVRFGDGRRGRIPIAGSRIVARSYRHGASKAGNLPAGLITALAANVPGVKEVINLRPSVGGADVQDVHTLSREAPARLRTLGRAVTAEDYESLALQVGTVARAIALPMTHPRHRNVEVPGSVTVVIVPDVDAPDPAPSPELVDEVRRHLDMRRTISAELHVVSPRYRSIKVVARVEADPYASFDLLKLAVAGAINAALDPLGRPPPSLPGVESAPTSARQTPREFGRDFAPTSLFGVMLDVDGVKAVPNLQIEVDGSPHDQLSERIVLDPDELLYGTDDHEISVSPPLERSTGGPR